MLALAVLLVLLAVAWPSLNGVYMEHHLREGAVTAQQGLLSARNFAQETGIAYRFQFEPGGNRYLIVPAEVEAAVASDAQGADPTVRTVPRVRAGTLPSGVQFAAQLQTAGGATNATQSVPIELMAGLPNADTLSGVAWSSPIYFSPEGSAAAVQLAVVNAGGFRILIQVRELTGGVILSAVQKEQGS